MFEQLDDSDSFEAGEAFFAATSRRFRRHRRRRGAARLTGGAMCAALAIPGFYGVYQWHRVDGIQRVDVPAISNTIPDVAPSATARHDTTAPTTSPLTDALTILMLGFDGGLGRPAESGQRTDTILVVRIDPSAGRIAVLGIPRDLWVSAENRKMRINALGNPQDPTALIDVLTKLGISIDHYIGLGMDGFTAMVDAVDPISLESTAALRDEQTGLRFPANACTTLDGATALQFVRSRHLEWFDGTTWQADPRSDLGRIVRTQLFGRALAGVLEVSLTAPTQVDRVIDAVAPNAIFDTGLTTRRLLSLVAAVRSIGVDDTEFTILAAVGQTIDGNAVLVADPRSWLDASAWLTGAPAPGAAAALSDSVGGTASSASPAITSC